MAIPETESSRLPVYLLLDCSFSMLGDPIVAVNQGTQTLVRELQDSPQALETAWVSVITFGGNVKQLVELTPVDRFQPPDLSASGGTPMGGALSILNNAINREVRTGQTQDHQKDYKPLVFLLTDGQPTDSWEESAKAIKNRADRKIADIYAIGCGNNADRSTLEKITDREKVFMMRDMTPGAFKQLFKWVSQSVARNSVPKNVDQNESTTMPPLPSVLQAD